MKVTFDSNILVYAADSQAGHRHSRAVEWMERAAVADCVLTLQSLAEFYNVATRKVGLEPRTAERFVKDWQAVFVVHAASADCLTDAMDSVANHGLSFWDAMLWATAREAGCRVLLSEDFQDGRSIGGVRFVNPFLADNAVLLEAALPMQES